MRKMITNPTHILFKDLTPIKRYTNNIEKLNLWLWELNLHKTYTLRVWCEVLEQDMSWICDHFSHYCVLNTRHDSRTSHPKLSLYKFCAALTPIVTSFIFLYCLYISWLEVYLFVLLITSYFHIYFLLIKTSKMFYFHWEGKGGIVTVMV